MKNTDFWAG